MESCLPPRNYVVEHSDLDQPAGVCPRRVQTNTLEREPVWEIQGLGKFMCAVPRHWPHDYAQYPGE